MQKSFWEEKWLQRQIGFHQSVPNKQLTQQFEEIYNETIPKSAFIPLCGKSLDIIWLSKRCQKVTGIEFCPLAINEFFQENNLPIEETGFVGNMPFTRSGNVTLIEGNIFHYTNDGDENEFDFIYDRAAIVALAPQTRLDYTKKLSSLSSENSYLLMITFEYDQESISGPPFSVPEFQLKELFGKDYIIDLRHEISEKPKSPRFVEAQIESFKRKTFLLQKRKI